MYPHIIPNIEDWPINRQAKNRSKFIATLNPLTEKRILKNNSELEKILSLTIYQERQRVKTNPWKVDPPDDNKYWSKMQSEFNNALQSEDPNASMTELLKRIINRYNEEIVGNFRVSTFKFIQGFLTSFYRRLLNPLICKGSWMPWGNKAQLFEKLDIKGEVEHMRTLFSKGTVLVLPTHSSNLDSIMVGYILDAICGVPSFAYGAGLNLFDFEIPAYFMNRLGAYRVDRRKKNPIYLECLKAMNCLSVYQGVNNIFFAGGTRSRSGALENKLKLGLLGSVVQAQRMHIEEGSDDKIFIVPMVLDYHFVLESKSLIESHLRGMGRENYRKRKSSFGFIRSNIRFVKTLLKKNSEVVISIAPPTDILGNKVDLEGNSLDEKGNIIDFKSYFASDDDVIETNNQREKIYTRLLGERVAESFRKNNIALSSHIIAFVAFEMFRARLMKSDYYSFLSTPLDELYIPFDAFKQTVIDTIDYLKTLESYGEIKLAERVKTSNVDDMLEFAFKNLGLYHTAKVLKVKNDTLYTEDLSLLLYYRNKLSGYKLEEKIDWSQR